MSTMPRYRVLRTDGPEGQDPLVTVEGYVEVQGGALVFRKGAFASPFWILATGCWTDVWIDETEEA